MKSLKIISLMLLVAITTMASAAEINPEALKKVERSVVTINATLSISAYHMRGSHSGTGFVADRASGTIVTNSHVANFPSVGTYFITFHNGKQLEAKVRYYDLWADFAIMVISDPKSIPSDVEELKFSTKDPRRGENVFIIGNNEGRDFSLHSGYLSNIYTVNGNMPSHSYVVNLNAAGGSSGSPLLNQDAEVVGLNYGGSRTFALALKANYITDALASIKRNEEPVRRHIGVLCGSYLLDKAVRHRHFPENLAKEYIAKYPDMHSKVLEVVSILRNSPAAGILEPGDILWAANNTPLGVNLYSLEQIMNNSKGDSIALTIIRDGQKLEKTIKLYDVNKSKINTIVDFGGLTFFQVDDLASAKSGAALGELAAFGVRQPGSSFSAIPTFLTEGNMDFYRFSLTSINKNKVTNLQELIAAIPGALKQKFVQIKFLNYQSYFYHFAGTPITAHEELSEDIKFDSTERPRVFRFNNTTLEWTAEDIK